MKTKLFGILLILSIIAPYATVYTWLQYRKSIVKKEVKWKMIRGLDKEALVLLKFNTKEIDKKVKWKHSKEFQYKGEMYDIVERTSKGDTTYFWCWWDHKETALNKQLSQLLTVVLNQDSKSNHHKNSLHHFYTKLFIEQYNPTQLFVFKTFSDRCYIESQIKYEIYLSNTSPPPELI